MKRYFDINKLVVFMVTLVLTLAVTAVALAKGTDEWKKAEGLYVWKQSAQYSNGFLYVKPMEEDLFLFEFKTMRGSEAEDSSYDYNVAGILLVNDKGEGEAEFDVDKKPVKLTFTLKGKTIAVKQTGEMPADVSGEYDFQEKSYNATEAAATAYRSGGYRDSGRDCPGKNQSEQFQQTLPVSLCQRNGRWLVLRCTRYTSAQQKNVCQIPGSGRSDCSLP